MKFLKATNFPTQKPLFIVLLCLALSNSKGSTIQVNSSSDAGVGTLREAITTANSDGAKDTITFSTLINSVTLTSNLPSITQPLFINGAGAMGGLFELNCNFVANGLDFQAGSSSSKVSFLVINQSTTTGITVSNGAMDITDCIIGLNLAGTSKLFNTTHGIHINGGTIYTIRDCVISGNGSPANPGSHGIYISNSASDIDIMGNYIGLDITGTTGIGNNAAGIYIESTVNVVDVNIGSSNSADRNVISANNTVNHNTEPGIRVAGENVTIQGNYIGLTADGLTALPNLYDGIFCIFGDDITIGGNGAGEGNVVSGNTRAGIWVNNGNQWGWTGTTYTITGNIVGLNKNGTGNVGNGTNGIIAESGPDFTIQNNYIGGNGTEYPSNPFSKGWNGIRIENLVTSMSDLTGNIIGFDTDTTTANGNKDDGIYIENSSIVFSIGGSTPTQQNIIGNSEDGFGIRFNSVSNKTVINNIIGANINEEDAGNGLGGILIYNSSNNNTIGGTGANQGNIVAYNYNGSASTSLLLTGTFDNSGFGFGLGVANNSTGNTISRNSIYCNHGLGIDLNFANNFQTGTGEGNSAIATPAIGTRTLTTISGTGPNNATIELFYNNLLELSASCDCEGKNYLTTTTAGGTGTWTANITGMGVIDPLAVTATATDPSGNTSQFEACNAVLPAFSLESQFNPQQEGFPVIEWFCHGNVDLSHFDIIAWHEDHNRTITTVVADGGQHYYASVNTDIMNYDTYQITSIDHNGNTWSSQHFPILNVKSLRCYASPGNNEDWVTIVCNGVPKSYKIWDDLGRLIHSSELHGSEFTLPRTSSGLYNLQVLGNSSTSKLKLIVP